MSVLTKPIADLEAILERWFEFMGNHPFLFGLLGILIFMLLTLDNKRSGKKVSATELGMLINQQNAQLIDIRSKKSFETGYIQGSRNIPFTSLKERLEEIRAIESPIVIVCDMGIQAGAAVQLIAKDNVSRLAGGINGWKSEGLPLVGAKSK